VGHLDCPGRGGQHALENWADADGKQGLLSVAQKIDDSALGVAEEDAFTVGEQVQTRAAREQVGETMTEFAAQQLDHLANALETEAATAQITEYGEFGEILGGVKTAMALAGRDYDSLLVPPLKLTRGEAGAF
jgi:hypothetical protein